MSGVKQSASRYCRHQYAPDGVGAEGLPRNGFKARQSGRASTGRPADTTVSGDHHPNFDSPRRSARGSLSVRLVSPRAWPPVGGPTATQRVPCGPLGTHEGQKRARSQRRAGLSEVIRAVRALQRKKRLVPELAIAVCAVAEVLVPLKCSHALSAGTGDSGHRGSSTGEGTTGSARLVQVLRRGEDGVVIRRL